MGRGRSTCAAALAALVLAGSAQAAQPPVQGTAHALIKLGARAAVVVLVDHGRTYAASIPPVHAPGLERFRIGSITKTFTATIVLQLVQEGKLRLDAPLSRYLAWAGPKARSVTIRDLLDHRSGLANYTDDPAWLAKADASRNTRPRDVLLHALAQPFVFRPRTSWAYSNTNYVALGLVIETVTGHSYAYELERRIVAPLGLRSTRFPTTRHVSGLSDPGTNPTLPWAAGAVVSDARDLAAFYAALFGGRLLGRAALNEMRQTVGPEHDGLGVFAVPLSCGTFWGHDGGILDYVSSVVASADGRRVLVISARGPLRGPAPPDRLLCR